MMPQNALFAYIRTHAGGKTRSKTWFVRFQDDPHSKKTLRYDSWFDAFRCWWRLKWHPFDYKPKIFKGE